MNGTTETLLDALKIADAERLRLSEEYQRRSDDGTSCLTGNMDWARLEGAVSVVKALRRAIDAANATPVQDATETPLPCPFCGSTDIEIDVLLAATHLKRTVYRICDGCAAEGPPRDSPQEALTAWNHRVPPG